MNESFRVGLALLLKTLYKNVALVKYLQIFPVKSSKNVSRSDRITGASYYSGSPILELL